MYTRDSIVAVRPFSRQQEGEEMVIGVQDTGIFLSLPPEAVELLDLLARGKNVGEVSDLYFQKTGETPDLEDLLIHLESKGIVGAQATHHPAASKQTVSVREIEYHFSGFPQSVARVLFGRMALTCEAAFIALALCAILRWHSLMPVPMDLVFYQQRALSWTLLTVFTYSGIFLHELAHLVAARSVGVNSRMGISHRLWYLVAETDLTGLWSVPRNLRYLAMLAGIILDALVASLLVLSLAAAQRNLFHLSPFASHLVRAMAFTNLLRILWEFFLFVRTDIYFVAVTYLNCKNLLVDTRVFLGNQLARIYSRIGRVDQSAIPPAERRAIRTYAALYLAGRAWAFITLFWVTIPVCLGYWASVVPAFRVGYSANPSNFLDALTATLYFTVPTIAGFVFWAGTLMRPKGVSK
jgi:putative peptide zinc metalloprotease protein